MSYTVLARKYRSQTFNDVIGQDPIAQTLKNAIKTDRVAHAYLFTGTRGVGKTSTALAFTQALNCLTPVEGEGCGKCKSCRQIKSGNFPDIIILKPDGQNIKIDQIRDLNRELSFNPYPVDTACLSCMRLIR